MFLEEIWSRNFTNLFITPIKKSEIITSLTITAIIRTLIGLVPVSLFAIPLFGVSIYEIGFILFVLLVNLHIFGITLGIFVSSGLIRYGPAFENIAWATLFLLAPLGCIYYPIGILPDWLQSVAKSLPLVYIFEEVRNILIYQTYSVINIFIATMITFIYFSVAVFIFCIAFEKSREKGTLMNMGE
jgi:ABC-2 type transport system permease protein